MYKEKALIINKEIINNKKFRVFVENRVKTSPKNIYHYTGYILRKKTGTKRDFDLRAKNLKTLKNKIKKNILW